MINEKYNWVKEQLENNPSLRDSNEKLYFKYLQYLKYDLSNSIVKFLQDMEKRKIPYIDIIGRVSRKVQEENPHLQGLKYGKRKKEIEPKIREEIRKMS